MRGFAETGEGMDEMVKEVRGLLDLCYGADESPVDQEVLRSRFRALVTPGVFASVGDAALDCEAFVLGSIDAAKAVEWRWPVSDLLRVGMLAAHFAHERDAALIADACVRAAPTRTDCLVFWASMAPSPHEAMERFRTAALTAADRPAIDRAARHFALHSENGESLLREWAGGAPE